MRINDFKNNIGIQSQCNYSLIDISDTPLSISNSVPVESASLNNKQKEFNHNNQSKKLEMDREILHKEYLFQQICADCAHRQAQSYMENNSHLSNHYQSIYNMCMVAARSSLENISKCERKISLSFKLNV